ncbi:MAG: hypothetical protein WAS07_01790 [Micropruina sp.]
MEQRPVMDAASGPAAGQCGRFTTHEAEAPEVRQVSCAALVT